MTRESVDYTRDGYRTVVLELGNPEGAELEACGGCGALGFPERIEEHDCREFKSKGGGL